MHLTFITIILSLIFIDSMKVSEQRAIAENKCITTKGGSK